MYAAKLAICSESYNITVIITTIIDIITILYHYYCGAGSSVGIQND
jgi:hypothetical protein